MKNRLALEIAEKISAYCHLGSHEVITMPPFVEYG
jgi:hypothetical protein